MAAAGPDTTHRANRRRATLQVTVDLVIMTIRDDALHVLLVERGNTPHQGRLALPGGFLRDRESLPDAARRELMEETSLDAGRLHLEQLGTYSEPDRDPRGRVVTVAYLAIAPSLPAPVAGTDARHARWEPVDLVTATPAQLAFDHDEILRAGLERVRGKLEYTTLATALCGETFTVGELRRVYETVWATTLDPRNFNRKVTGTEGFVVPTGQKRQPATGRPAAVYRRGPATVLYPPMLRTRITTGSD
ncbi:NUDIX hydrolase [Micromonospora sp. KLBMP9576]|uniref:NUDIX hydrolase n=1 Tax=Micromonospora sp. KLBMP9576 TaxID=3424769 RepID=UPI003D91C794